MLEIALARTETGILQKDIAVNQDISVKYLDHIIIALKVAGLIANIRGKKSGYRLSRDPSLITMYDIHNAFEHGICVIDCIDHHIICEREDACATRDFWQGLNDQIVAYFKSFTLKDLIERHLKFSKDLQMQSRKDQKIIGAHG